MAEAAGGGGKRDIRDDKDINIPVEPVVDLQQSIDSGDREVPKMPKRRPKTFERSFASHPKAKYWHPTKNGKLTPRDLFKNSNAKYWFKCPDCEHDFDTFLKSISRGSWCPHCTNKTEKKLFTWLKAICSKWEAQLHADWCRNPKTGKYLPFDFVHHKHKLILELDGQQHFKKTSNWQSPEDTQVRDHYKMKCAIDKGYKVIRILQEPVFKDSIDWQSDLLVTFSLSQLDDSTNVFYLGDDTCKSYDCYKKST